MDGKHDLYTDKTLETATKIAGCLDAYQSYGKWTYNQAENLNVLNRCMVINICSIASSHDSFNHEIKLRVILNYIVLRPLQQLGPLIKVLKFYIFSDGLLKLCHQILNHISF